MPIANTVTGPTWSYLSTTDASVAGANSVFATNAGWVQRHPGPAGRQKDEILIAIDQLASKLGAPKNYLVEVVTSALSNVGGATGNVAIRVLFNQPVVVTGTPALRAIGAGGLANVNLVYDSTQSDPSAGKLVFANNAAVLNVAVNSTSTLVVNSTSAFTGANVNAALNNTAVTVNATLAFSNSVLITVYKPTLTGILAGPAGSNVANSIVKFTLQYNEAVTVTSNSTAPSIVAISNHGASVANQVVVFDSVNSNGANGTLIFSKASVDTSSVNAGFIAFAINSTSTLVGFPLIAGTADANAAQNTLNGIANTQTF